VLLLLFWKMVRFVIPIFRVQKLKSVGMWQLWKYKWQPIHKSRLIHISSYSCPVHKLTLGWNMHSPWKGWKGRIGVQSGSMASLQHFMYNEKKQTTKKERWNNHSIQGYLPNLQWKMKHSVKSVTYWAIVMNVPNQLFVKRTHELS
jgi:hypothetical protein